MTKKITSKEISNHPKNIVREIAADLDDAVALDALSISTGGQLLVNGLITDIISVVDTLCSTYKTLTNQEFVGYCAEVKNKLDLVRAIKRAKKNRKFLEELLTKELNGESE